MVDVRTSYLAGFPGRERLNLVGYNLPYRDNSFKLAVINHYLGLFSDYFIFRIITQAIRLAGTVVIFEDSDIFPKVLKICQSFASAHLEVGTGSQGDKPFIRITRRPVRSTEQNTIGAFLPTAITDYLANTARPQADPRYLSDLQREFGRRALLFSLLDGRKCFYLNTDLSHFGKTWENGFPEFRALAGRLWQWSRREEWIPEESGQHLFLESTLFWLPGVNIKWFYRRNDPIFKIGRKLADQYSFFIDANIYANHSLKALSRKAGLDGRPSLIYGSIFDDPAFFYQLDQPNRDWAKLKTILSLLVTKAQGRPLTCHIYFLWGAASIAAQLPEFKAVKGRWPKYLHGFELARQAEKEQQMDKVRKIANKLDEAGLFRHTKLHLINSEEFRKLSKEKEIAALDSLDRASMLALAAAVSAKLEAGENPTKRLFSFLSSIKLSAERLNIRACYYFLLSQNFDRARPFIKRIKNRDFAKTFSAILAVETGDYAGALKTFEELKNHVGKLPSFIVSHLYATAGVAYYESGSVALAFSCWRKSLKLNKENSLARMSIIFRDLLR